MKLLLLQGSNYQSTIAQVISTRKSLSNKQTLSQIVDCVCSEISKNVEERKAHKVTHLDYIVSPSKLHEKILRNIEPYDENLEFVTKINRVLIANFVPIDDIIDFETPTKLAEPTTDTGNYQKPTTSQNLVERDEYCTKAMDVLQELNQTYEDYYEDPTKHPSYIKEWVKFFEKNKGKVLKEFQLEWKKHFKSRLIEFKRFELNQRLTQLNDELTVGVKRSRNQRQIDKNSSGMEQVPTDEYESEDREEMTTKRQRVLVYDETQGGFYQVAELNENSGSNEIDFNDDCILLEPKIDLIVIDDDDNGVI